MAHNSPLHPETSMLGVLKVGHDLLCRHAELVQPNEFLQLVAHLHCCSSSKGISWSLVRLSLATLKICHLRLRVTYISYMSLATRRIDHLPLEPFGSKQGKVGWGMMVSFPGTCKPRMTHQHWHTYRLTLNVAN